MILNCLKYFKINTKGVIFKYLWVVHLSNLSGVSGPLKGFMAEVGFKGEVQEKLI